MKLTSVLKNQNSSQKLLKLNKSKSNKKGILNTTSLNKSLQIKQQTMKSNQLKQKCNQNLKILGLKSKKNIQLNENQNNLLKIKNQSPYKTHMLGQKSNKRLMYKYYNCFSQNQNTIKSSFITDNLQQIQAINNLQINKSHKRHKSQAFNHQNLIENNQKSQKSQNFIKIQDKIQSNINNQQNQINIMNQSKENNINKSQNIGDVMLNKMKKIKNFMKNKFQNELQITQNQKSVIFFNLDINDNKQNLQGNLFNYCPKTQNNLNQKHKLQKYPQSPMQKLLSLQPEKILNHSYSNQIQNTFKHELFSQSFKKPLQLNDFTIGKKIGKGRFGNVFSVQHIDTQSIYALKILSKNQIKQEQMQDQILLEIKLQLYLNHPNILKLYSFFHDQEYIYLILQYATQSCIFKKLRKEKKFTQNKVASYAKQIIQSMKNFHSENVLHRDIKPQNIMLNFDSIKIADFGWAVYSPIYKRQTFCGTVDYVSPEIIKGQFYDQKVDIWSLGILLYQLTVGKAPFQGSNNIQNQTFQRILSNNFILPNQMSLDLKYLIQRILSPNPDQRMSLTQIQSSKWMKKYQNQGRYVEQEIINFWNKMN